MQDVRDAADCQERPAGRQGRALVLYGSILSPFVRKVMAYAAEKGVALTLAPGGMGRGGAEFAQASPLGKMPALRHPGADDGRDFTVADSTAIITYIEALHPAPAMIPAAPIPRARTAWFEKVGDTVQAAGRAIFFNRFVLPRAMKRPGDEAAASAAERDELPPLFDYLEGVVPDDGWLVGPALTLADIAVASPFVNLAHVGVTVEAARWPRLAAYIERVTRRPSFADLLVQERRIIEALS